ncbi:hypothetical protein IMZ48_26220 [Candidatus Bathyarchaeota archaeon]|nr:hypothetical protein [Candidatus Bathyarchaeota archaeon]
MSTNVINVPIAGSPRFQQDTAMAIARIKTSLGPNGAPTFTSFGLSGLTASKPVYANASKVLASITVGSSLSFSAPTLNTIQGIRTTDTPTFAGLTLTAFSGVVKATAGVLAGGGAHADLATVTANQHHNQAHVLNGADHTVSGLTTGHVLQATGATTFGFAAVPGLHDSVTLATSADVLLGLTSQALSLDTQVTKRVLIGPISGADAAPTFRVLETTDIPALAYEASGAITTHAGLTTGVHGLAITAGQTLTVTTGGTLASGAYAAAHDAVTLGTANGLSLTGQVLSLPTIDLDLTNIIAGGASACYIGALQGTNALTGTLRGVYSTVTNGEFASSGTIRAFEGKARAATSGLVGGNVGTLEGMSLTADAKNKTVTTLRGAEIIMDGQAGAAVTTATGLRISNNFQAAIATTSYGLQIYRDSFDYTADMLLSKGGTITGDSYLNQDCRIAASPTFAGLVIDAGDSGGVFSIPCRIKALAVGAGVDTYVTNTDPVATGFARFVASTTGFACSFEAFGNNYVSTTGARRGGAAVVYGSGSAGLSLCAGFSNGVLRLYTGGNTDAKERMCITAAGLVLIGKTSGTEKLEVNGKIRADTAFNLNGTDGVTQAAAAGKVSDVTALAGGIATAQTQITYAADNTYANPTSITIVNGRITAIS